MAFLGRPAFKMLLGGLQLVLAALFLYGAVRGDAERGYSRAVRAPRHLQRRRGGDAALLGVVHPPFKLMHYQRAGRWVS